MPSFKLYILSIMNNKRHTADSYIMGAVLSVCSFIYLIGLKCVYFLYSADILRTDKVSAKVISVGNITLGGTGKTPFVIVLAERAQAMGRKVTVLTRGYGDDESHLLKARLDGIHVLTGQDRAGNARRAISEFGSDCIILDDGFQHHRLKRDLDIVLIDATYAPGNMRLFPRGTLREPLSRLGNAHIVLLTKTDMGSSNKAGIYAQLNSIKSGIKIAESFYKAVEFKKILSDGTEPLSFINGKRTALVAAIANTEYFEWMINNLGANISERFYYADHHIYTKDDADYIIKKCAAGGINTIITTEKDVMRGKSSGSAGLADLLAGSSAAKAMNMELLTLGIDFKISKNEEAIVAGLRSLFNSQVF